MKLYLYRIFHKLKSITREMNGDSKTRGKVDMNMGLKTHFQICIVIAIFTLKFEIALFWNFLSKLKEEIIL